MKETIQNQADKDIRINFERCIHNERLSEAKLLAYICEYENRRLFLEDGYSSMFKLLTEKYFYSEAAASRRCHAATLLRRFPSILTYIQDGSLSLSNLNQLYYVKDLEDEKMRDLILKVRFCSQAKAEEVISSFTFVKPSSQRDHIKAVKVLKRVEAPSLVMDLKMDNEVKLAKEDDHKISASVQESTPKLIEEISFRLGVTISKGCMDKLERVQDLMGESDLATNLEKLLDFYISKKDPMHKFEKVTSAAEVESCEEKKLEIEEQEPSNSKQKNSTRYIPRHIKAAVFRKYDGKCSYVDKASGHRCGSKRYLEMDHIFPFSQCKEHKIENLQLLCSAHHRMKTLEEREFL